MHNHSEAIKRFKKIKVDSLTTITIRRIRESSLLKRSTLEAFQSDDWRSARRCPRAISLYHRDRSHFEAISSRLRL